MSIERCVPKKLPYVLPRYVFLFVAIESEEGGVGLKVSELREHLAKKFHVALMVGDGADQLGQLELRVCTQNLLHLLSRDYFPCDRVRLIIIPNII